MADGFIKICRKMLKWEWYKNVNTRILFIHCLLMANWEPGSWRGIDYKAGEFVTSLPNLATGCGLSIQQTRTALSNLQSTGEITVKALSTGRIITVNNWNKYQTVTDYLTGNQQDINRQPNRQSTGNLTSDKEIKNIRKEEEKNNKKKIIKEKPVYYPNDEALDKAFTDYVAMRKQIKKPLTDRAIELAMKKVADLSNGDNDLAIKIIEQSVLNSWQGLFPIKDNLSLNKSIDWSKV